VLTLTADANERLLQFERELEPQLAPDAELGPLADWGSKLAGAVVRIAGLLHLAQHGEVGHRVPIDAETMRDAENIGRYFLAHALVVHEIMGMDPAVDDARALLGWLAKLEEPWFSKRDAHRANQTWFRKANELEPALNLLESRGWLRRRPEPPHGGRGRPTSPVYDVNPRIAQGNLDAY
jgi:hypothetical protein